MFWFKGFIRSEKQGFLNTNQFNFKSLNNSKTTSNSTLPTSIQVQATVNGTFLNVTLNQMQGILNTASFNNKVYQMLGSKVQQIPGANLVKK